MPNDPKAAYAAFQAEVQRLVSSPLWGQIESELKRLRPRDPSPEDATFVVAQRAFLCMGYDNALEKIRLIPGMPVPQFIAQAAQAEAEDDIITRVAQPEH